MLVAHVGQVSERDRAVYKSQTVLLPTKPPCTARNEPRHQFREPPRCSGQHMRAEGGTCVRRAGFPLRAHLAQE